MKAFDIRNTSAKAAEEAFVKTNQKEE